MKEILLQLIDLIEKVSGVMYVSEDYGQIDFTLTEHGTHPVKFPCALISVTNIEYNPQGKYTDTAVATIAIRVANDPVSIASGKAPERYKQQAFAILDVIEAIDSAVHGYKGDTFKQLQRQGVQKSIREDCLREYTMFFRTSYVIEKEKRLRSLPTPPNIRARRCQKGRDI